MIYGIGTDIFKISRLDYINNNFNDSFILKSFTLSEREQAKKRTDPIIYYATRFAGKEAVFKSISRCGCDFRASDIEIINMDNGQPKVNILGKTSEKLNGSESSNLIIHVSLSFESDNAVAVAITELI